MIQHWFLLLFYVSKKQQHYINGKITVFKRKRCHQKRLSFFGRTSKVASLHIKLSAITKVDYFDIFHGSSLRCAQSCKMLIWGGLGGQALVLSQKVCRELCQQPGAVEKVHARVHVRRNRRSTRPLHGHLIKTTCGGLHRYCDCNFASQWPFTISCNVACVSGATHRPSGLGLFYFYLWSKSSFIQDVCLTIHYMAWNPILFPKSPFTLSKPAKKPG